MSKVLAKEGSKVGTGRAPSACLSHSPSTPPVSSHLFAQAAHPSSGLQAEWPVPVPDIARAPVVSVTPHNLCSIGVTET